MYHLLQAYLVTKLGSFCAHFWLLKADSLRVLTKISLLAIPIGLSLARPNSDAYRRPHVEFPMD